MSYAKIEINIVVLYYVVLCCHVVSYFQLVRKNSVSPISHIMITIVGRGKNSLFHF